MKILIISYSVLISLVGLAGILYLTLSSPVKKHEPLTDPTQAYLIERVWELDSIILNHTYGPLATRYEYGAVEKDYNRKWHITSDSLYALRRRAQNEFNAYNANK